jgi:hypothetical protein
MATPDTIKQKQKREGDELANPAHIVTPDPDEDPGVPKVGVIREHERKVDASPKKKPRDGGHLRVGVDFDGNKE